MNIIETHTLSHHYWRTEALRELTLAVPTGSVYALLGANGAGKSTAIKVLMNLLQPTGGSAQVMGVDSRKLGPKQLERIGYVSENQQLPQWMTVRQLLDYCRPFYPTWDVALEKKLLAEFGLPEKRKLAQLSRGMLMKAALLSSLAYRPQLLVLDEPFSGLDAVVRDDFVKGLLEAAALGEWTVFISSHDIEEVERLADRIGFLEAGRLRFSETTESLLKRFRRIEVTLSGEMSPEVAPAGSWVEWKSSGHRVSFIETAYAREATERACYERFPEAAVQAQPMTLREIFVALAREKQTQAQGVRT